MEDYDKMSLLPYALGFGVVAGLWMIADHLWRKNKLPAGMALLYDKIGDSEVFRDIVKIHKVKTNSVTCLKIKGETESFIDVPDSRDYFQSKKYGKVLHVVKFGDRDFRIKKRFDGDWFKKVEQQVFDYKEETNPESGETETVKIPVLDEGNLVYELINEQYVEPLGIDQKGMDSVRTSLQNEREINKELETGKFWEKYGNTITIMGAVMICALMIMKVSQDVNDTAKFTSATCDAAAEKVENAAKKIDEPHWASNLLDKVAERNSVPEPPPR